ncbi:3-phosphoglycerate dehydrogenase [Candidatus Gottesmanbacteria bacterium]|nr:3-phosphoglycerate dehydrogenase [Candidatus Gottesmanbacteria bacterium]
MIVHFDVDKTLNSLLQGEKHSIEITPKTLSRIKNKDKITVMSVKTASFITKEVLEAFPKLKMLQTRTVGIDHIDLTSCKERKIAVYHIPNYGPYNVAQHAIALMLTGARNIISANIDTHSGNFSYKNFLGISMHGKNFGVIGTGKIGIEAIKIGKSLGMNILAFDIFKNENAAKQHGFSYTTLSKLLKESDVITLHIPSTKETYHMLGEKEFKLIKNNAILVNTARGDLIDIKALIQHANKFHSICLDVVEGELTFNKKHPLLKLKNCIITPHSAFYTDDSMKIIAKETEENIKRFQKGDRTNRVV